MNTIIFFTDLDKLHDALAYFSLSGFTAKKIPVKLHMGEINNKWFPKPDFVKHVIDELLQVKADPFLFDTTVAYPGLRHSRTGYEKVAKLHGFTMQNVGCEVVIDDTGVPITVEGRSFDVGSHLAGATHVFAISHVKGHLQTGMGGAIKNFGMGGVTKETKIRIHQGSRPVYQKDACTFCGVCAEVCPFDAITVQEDSWNHSSRACFGCGVCIDACKNSAITYQDADMQYLLACAAYACVKDKSVLYLNELKRIVKKCDCDPSMNPVICPDIGYVLGVDPVAVDKASLDRINNVKENVFEKENGVSPLKQIKYGEEIGLGSSSYELIEL